MMTTRKLFPSLPRWLATGLACVGLFLTSSCGGDRDAVRVYREVSYVDRPAEAAPQAPTAMPMPDVAPVSGGTALNWDTPEGWAEAPGSGMRLATFTMGSAEEPGTCTMVLLVGVAGGLEANIERWLGQLDLSVPAGEEFKSFVDAQERFTTAGGLPVVLVDLTGLTEVQSDRPDSMLAGVVLAGEQTVFVKLTGPVTLLNKEKERLSALCRSVRFE